MPIWPPPAIQSLSGCTPRRCTCFPTVITRLVDNPTMVPIAPLPNEMRAFRPLDRQCCFAVGKARLPAPRKKIHMAEAEDDGGSVDCPLAERGSGPPRARCAFNITALNFPSLSPDSRNMHAKTTGTFLKTGEIRWLSFWCRGCLTVAGSASLPSTVLAGARGASSRLRLSRQESAFTAPREKWRDWCEPLKAPMPTRAMIRPRRLAGRGSHGFLVPQRRARLALAPQA
jgi:hypothetical protein